MKTRLTLTTLLILTALAIAGSSAAADRQLVVWAWERPEDLRFLPADVEIAVQSGFVVLSKDHFSVRGRRFPLKARAAQVRTAVVHVQIDGNEPPAWNPALSARMAAAVVRLGAVAGVDRLQIDFEVPASKRSILLDLLRDVRAALPAKIRLSMTALTSWCLGETWMQAAPVDEVVPMLFRMGRDGREIDARFSGGKELQPYCRSSIAVSTDAPAPPAPLARRVYLFNPRSWTAMDFSHARERVNAWKAP